jgi:hypothetical protein
MYEIIAEPEEYGIEALVNGLTEKSVFFETDERKKWAGEVSMFADRLDGLSEKARDLEKLLNSQAAIKATPASLKTLKIQLFNINDALTSSLDLADRLESEIIEK